MINKVILIGNVGSDPDLVQTKNSKVAKFSLATSEKYKDGDEWKEVTEWHTVNVWGSLADVVANHVKKGSKLYIEGKLKTDMVEADGVKKYYTKVVANTMRFLDNKEKRDERPTPEPITETPQANDDLPF